jgi:transposase
MTHTILLTVDYHDQNCVVRQRHLTNHHESVTTLPTTPTDLSRFLAQARKAVGRRGRLVWVQESTTGWARVKNLLGESVDEFALANVLQMPRPPKAHRRKTDRTDTARIQREYLNGELPRAHQPPASWRQLRRLVSYRENLVARRTSLRNWINRYLAHETWEDRTGLWSTKGQKRLKSRIATWPPLDQLVANAKLGELERLEETLAQVEAELVKIYHQSPDAQRLDAIRGIGPVSAVSIVARIGPVERFASADSLIAYAGLAPGVEQSDQTRRNGKIGGGGTDGHLRHYLIEATIWARRIPRYRSTYDRVSKRRGTKIGRLVVARLLLRSIFKVLRDGIAFESEGTRMPREVSVPR